MACRTSSIDSRRRFGNRRGFSVAEAMMATTLLAIAVVGIAGPLGAASEQSRTLLDKCCAIFAVVGC